MKNNGPVTQQEVKFPATTYLVSQTDLKGIIRDANEAFVAISGFSRSELMGNSHNIVRHPDMPATAFADMWSSLKSGLPWRGMVKNRCKNGDHYWVDALVVPITKNGERTGYMSVRKAPSRQQISEAEQQYASKKLKATRRKALPLGALFYSLFALMAGAIIVNVLVMKLGLPEWLDMFTGIVALLPILPIAWLVHFRIFKRLAEFRASISLLAEGDLSVRHAIERPDEIGQLMNALSIMQTRWLMSIDRIREATQASLLNMELMDSQADTINRHINDQHDRVAAVAAATEEFCQAVAEVASCSSDTSRAADESGALVYAGKTVMQEGMESSQAAVSAVADSRNRIAELNKAVTGIGTVSQVIKEIADQTNLLALNAAIEAARAGESGRGFAVVADEVRKLAERTTGSTLEISAMVNDIQRLTQAVDSVMDQTATTVIAGTEKMQKSIEHLESVSAATDHTKDLARHIADASEQQAVAGQEVARNMEQISSLSETNQRGVKDLWQALKNLSSASQHIDHAVSVFHLFDETDTTNDNGLALASRLSMAEQIDKAIAAHSTWKSRLSKIVEEGSTDIPVATIKANDQCAFGKWLKNDMPAAAKNGSDYQHICELHSRFHRCAGEVAELACSGKTELAKTEMGSEGNFHSVSSALVSALTHWKRQISR